MTKIHIPTPLRQYAGKQPTVEVKAGTVAEALSGLVSKHPELKRHLYTDDGKLRSFVNVYVNDEDVRYLQKEATAVNDSDIISIGPSIAGGRRAYASPTHRTSNVHVQRPLFSNVLLPGPGHESSSKQIPKET